MPRHACFAISIDRFDYGETSQIVHFLTDESGRLALLAKGAHRPKNSFGGSIDLLVYSRIEYMTRDSSEGLLLLGSRQVLTNFPALRTDLARYQAATYLRELLRNSLPERQVVTGLFELFRAALLALHDRPHQELLSIVFAFEWRLLKMMGLAPQLTSCVRCGEVTDPPCFFSLGEGGLLCRSCGQGELPMKPRTHEALRLLDSKSAAELAAEPKFQGAKVDVRRLLDRFLSYQLERPLDASRWLLDLGGF